MIKIKIKKKKYNLLEKHLNSILEKDFHNFLTENEIDNAPGGTSKLISVLQGVLDIIGFVPALGEVADGINIIISLLRKDFLGAALSAISLIPVAGDAVAKPLKFAIKAGGAENVAKLLSKLSPKTRNLIKQHSPKIMKELQNPSTIKKIESGISTLLKNPKIPKNISQTIEPLIKNGAVKQGLESGLKLITIINNAPDNVEKNEIPKNN